MRKTTCARSQANARDAIGSFLGDENLINLDSRFGIGSNYSGQMHSFIGYQAGDEQTPQNPSFGTMSLQVLGNHFPQTNLSSVIDLKNLTTRETVNHRAPLPDLAESIMPVGPSITVWGRETNHQAISSKKKQLDRSVTSVKPSRNVKELDLCDDFECSMEEDEAFYDGWSTPEPRLTFADKKRFQLDNNGKAKFYALGDVLDTIERVNRPEKKYRCWVCGKELASSASLGGHISRVHPASSKAYTHRRRTLKIRKGERNRKQFLDRV